MDMVERLREKALEYCQLAQISTDNRAIEALISKARQIEVAADLMVALRPDQSRQRKAPRERRSG